MARGWKCARCSTQNGEGVMNCAKCGLIQGGVVVPSSYTPEPPTAPPPLAAPLSSAAPPSLPPAAQGVGAPLNLEPIEGQPAAGWVPPYPAAQAAPRPIWRRIPIRLAIFGAIILAGAVGGFITNASRSSTGDITKGGDLTSNDLRVGDCWDMKDPSADKVDNVTARPCTESHEYEAFFIGSMPEGIYPTEGAFSTFVQSACIPAFGTYIGKTYDDSVLDISWLYPETKGWTLGDRTIECSAYDPRNSKLTASLKGSGQ
jgi:hypothetical protein